MRPVRRVVRRFAVVVAALALLPLAPAAFAAPGPPDAPQWWVDSWQVHQLWASGADGRGITIGEIDSGVNAQVPELKSKILKGIDYSEPADAGQVDHEVDKFGHGTAMASIMVASSGIFGIEGLAPGARILPVAIPLTGTGNSTGNDHLADAIRYAADHGAKIINMSLGASRDPQSDSLACPKDEQDAIFHALSKGAILVAAAGNNGPTDNDIEEPSVCLGVVTVGAIDRNRTVATFSSRRPNMTVTAPGVNVPSLGRVPGQAYNGKGTSQATALTSAALALVWSKYPKLTNREVLARLLATLDRPHATPDPAYGYGEINPADAINMTVPAGAPNPVFAAADPFIAQAAATDLPKPVPPGPAQHAAAPPGRFRADLPPSDFNDEVKIATGVAAAGLLCLLLLIAFGLRGRRRRNAEGAATLAPAWAAPAAPLDSPMPWRDVFEPPAWAAPTEPPQWSVPPGQASVPYPPPSLTRTLPPPPQWLPPDR